VRAAGGDARIWRRETELLQSRLRALHIHQIIVMHVFAFPEPERDWWLMADYRDSRDVYDYEAVDRDVSFGRSNSRHLHRKAGGLHVEFCKPSDSKSAPRITRPWVHNRLL
jgi:hypothetical protein